MLYERMTPRSMGATAEFPALAVPPGVALPVEVAEMLRDVIPALGLPEAEMVTPWATRQSDLEWQDVVKPDTNIGMFVLSDKSLAHAATELFGLQLPFVAVLSTRAQPIAEIERITEKAGYDLYETQAVYRQDDPKPLPDVYYVHWMKVKDVADMPREIVPMEQVAKAMSGKLRYAQQVPVESTTVRQAPGLTFTQAMSSDGGPPVPILPPVQTTMPTSPTSTPTQIPVTTVPPASPPVTASVAPRGKPTQEYLMMAAIGLGVAAATVALGRTLKHGR